MIEWLNYNQGFVMAILTVVYVIATVLICVFTHKSVKASAKQIEGMKISHTQNLYMEILERRLDIHHLLSDWCSRVNIALKEENDAENVFRVFLHREPLAMNSNNLSEKNIVLYAITNLKNICLKLHEAEFLFSNDVWVKVESFTMAFSEIAYDINANKEITSENIERLKTSCMEIESEDILNKMRQEMKFMEVSP